MARDECNDSSTASGPPSLTREGIYHYKRRDLQPLGKQSWIENRRLTKADVVTYVN